MPSDEKNVKEDVPKRVVKRILRPPTLPSQETSFRQFTDMAINFQKGLYAELEKGVVTRDTPEEKLAFLTPAVEPLGRHGNLVLKVVEISRKLTRDQEERERRKTG